MVFKILSHLFFRWENQRARFRSWYFSAMAASRGGGIGAGFRAKRGSKIDVSPGGILKIEEGFVLAEGADIFVGAGGQLSIGRGVFLGKGSTIAANGKIRIGDGTQIAHLVTIIDSDHEYRQPSRSLVEQGGKIGSVEIGKNVWIGANSVILRDTQIGDNAVVGASSVVTRSVAAKNVVGGNPARPLHSPSTSP